MKDPAEEVWKMRSLRFWFTLAGSIIVLLSVLTIAGVWIWNLKFGLPVSADKITRINTAVAASAYIAAIIAAIFALVAYWQTSGLPSLEPEINFLPFRSRPPTFTATRHDPPPPWVDINLIPFPDSWKGTLPPVLDRGSSSQIFTVVLTNKTKYAARNPGLRIHFDGLLYNGIPREWTSEGQWGEKNGLKSIQWDGGTENIVHGKWSRTLPIVGFNEIVLSSYEPKLVVTVVADGCLPKEFKFPLIVHVCD